MLGVIIVAIDTNAGLVIVSSHIYSMLGVIIVASDTNAGDYYYCH